MDSKPTTWVTRSQPSARLPWFLFSLSMASTIVLAVLLYWQHSAGTEREKLIEDLSSRNQQMESAVRTGGDETKPIPITPSVASKDEIAMEHDASTPPPKADDPPSVAALPENTPPVNQVGNDAIRAMIPTARARGAAIQNPVGYWEAHRELVVEGRKLSQRDQTLMGQMALQIMQGDVDVFTPKTFAWWASKGSDGQSDTPKPHLLRKFFPYMITDTESDYGLDMIATRRIGQIAKKTIRGEVDRITESALLRLPENEAYYILTYYPYMVDYGR